MINLSFWFMFPVALVFASIAMMAGIGGAILFSPFFIIILKIDPLVALASGLVIEFFGFSSGLIGYWSRKSIHFQIIKRLIVFTVPATVVGVVLGRIIPALALKSMLGVLILYLAYEFLFAGKECIPKHPACTGIARPSGQKDLTPMIKATTLFGGLLLGMISSGLGEMNEYNFLRKLRMPTSLSSGTSVFLVAMSATVGSLSHAFFLSREHGILTEILPLLFFTVPGVIIGAQIGVALSKAVNARAMGKFVGILFLVIGMSTLISIFT